MRCVLIRPYFRLLQDVIRNDRPQRGSGAIRHKLKKHSLQCNSIKCLRIIYQRNRVNLRKILCVWSMFFFTQHVCTSCAAPGAPGCFRAVTGESWGEIGAILNKRKVSLFTQIFYNSENNIRDISPFCRPLFCHSSVVKYTSSLLQQ